MFNLEKRGRTDNAPFPLPKENSGVVPFDGLVPDILFIIPVTNLPVFLGATGSDDAPGLLSRTEESLQH